MPAARLCGARAAAATDGGPPRALEALQCRALELQLWGSLPAFCSWPEDAAEAFRSLPPPSVLQDSKTTYLVGRIAFNGGY